MDTAEFGEIYDALKAGTYVPLQRGEVLYFLSEARLRKTPLSDSQMNRISTIVQETAPKGWQKQVQQNGAVHRHIWRKNGALLPSESGDDTP